MKRMSLWIGAPGLLVAGVAFASGSAGTLDPSFGGGDGIALTPTVGANVRRMAIDSVGRTVAVGFEGSTGRDRWYVARFAPDGSLDTTFAAGAGSMSLFGSVASDQAFGVAIDDAGRILVAGSVTWQVSGGKKPKTEKDFGLIRLQPDGAMDPSFGSGGIVLTGFSGNGSADTAYVVLSQPDGRTVVAGGSVQGGYANLARYTASGALDTTFGAGSGKVVLSLGGVATPCALRRDSAGRYVLLTRPGTSGPTFLVRLLANGALDNSFGSRNLTSMLTPLGSNFWGAGLQLATDESFVVCGRIGTGSASDSVVAKFSAIGNLDTTFGSGGATVLGLPWIDEARAVAIDAVGRILLASLWSDPARGNKWVFVASRLLATGALDANYGSGGLGQVADAGGTSNMPWDAAIDASGKFVAVGGGQVMSTSAVMLVRWLPD